ncbi:hypothetical protein LguiB_018285 [Lonicera macranthoides]
MGLPSTVPSTSPPLATCPPPTTSPPPSNPLLIGLIWGFHYTILSRDDQRLSHIRLSQAENGGVILDL